MRGIHMAYSIGNSQLRPMALRTPLVAKFVNLIAVLCLPNRRCCFCFLMVDDGDSDTWEEALPMVDDVDEGVVAEVIVVVVLIDNFFVVVAAAAVDANIDDVWISNSD